MTDHGKETLIRLEGCRLAMYRDSAGLWSIGVGHLLTKDELFSGRIRTGASVFDYRQGLTREQAMLLMEQDLIPASFAVMRAVEVPLTPPQCDALTLFAFNIGGAAFRNSTLVKKLNRGDIASVPSEMRRWIYAAGVKVTGLIYRREAEIQVWNATTI